VSWLTLQWPWEHNSGVYTYAPLIIILNGMRPERDSQKAIELAPEYEFDYRRARPNRFTVTGQQRIVILEPDVAEYFHDSESVNRVLRALIKVMPKAD